MRKIDIKTYLSSKKHDHAVCIHSLPKDLTINRVASIILEYAAKSYVDLGNRIQEKKGPNKELDPFAWKELEKQANTPKPQQKLAPPQESSSEIGKLLKSGTPDTKISPESLTLIEKVYKQFQEQFQETVDFTDLVSQFERFYARVDKKGRNSAQYEGKGMILALDDAPGIAMDLSQMINERVEAFRTQEAFIHPLVSRECVMEAMKLSWSQARKDIETARTNMQRMAPDAPPTAYENHLIITDEEIRKEYEFKMKKYWQEYLDVEKWNAFFGEDSEFVKKSKELTEKTMFPLAKAHIAWFRSQGLVDYFVCNFDNSDTDPVGWREHGGPYTALLQCCIGDTGDFPLCAQSYRELIEDSPLDENNLIWMGLNLNRLTLTNNIKDFVSTLESIENEMSALAAAEEKNPTAPEDEVPLKSKMAKFIADWAWAWWDAHNNAHKTALVAFMEDPAPKIKLFDDADTAFKNSMEAFKKTDANALSNYNKHLKLQRQLDDTHTSLGMSETHAERLQRELGNQKFIGEMDKATVTTRQVGYDLAQSDVRGARWEANNAASNVKTQEGVVRNAGTDVAATQADLDQSTQAAKDAANKSNNLRDSAQKARLDDNQAQAKRNAAIEYDNYLKNQLAAVTEEYNKAMKKLPELKPGKPLGKLMAGLQAPLADIAAKYAGGLPVKANALHILMLVFAHEGSPPLILRLKGSVKQIKKDLKRVFGKEYSANIDKMFKDDSHGNRTTEVLVKVSSDMQAVQDSAPTRVIHQSMSEMKGRLQLIGSGKEFDTRILGRAIRLDQFVILGKQIPLFIDAQNKRLARDRFVEKLNGHQQELARTIAAAEDTAQAAHVSETEYSNAQQVSDSAERARVRIEESLKASRQRESDEQARLKTLKTQQTLADQNLKTNLTTLEQKGTQLGAAQYASEQQQKRIQSVQESLQKVMNDVEAGRANSGALNVEITKSKIALNESLDTHTIAELNVLEDELRLSRQTLTQETAHDLRVIMTRKLWVRSGYAAVGVIMAFGVTMAWWYQLEKFEKLGIQEGKDYEKAKSMYCAGALTFAGAVMDIIYAGAELLAHTRPWAWAISMHQTLKNSAFYTGLSRIFGSVLSLMGGVWDLDKSFDLFDDRQYTAAILHFLMGGLGVAIGIFILNGNPVAITLMFVYAAFVLFVSDFLPTELELWLNNCYFGHRPKWNWEEELIAFKSKTGVNVSKDRIFKINLAPAKARG
jgi:hypothetical protein